MDVTSHDTGHAGWAGSGLRVGVASGKRCSLSVMAQHPPPPNFVFTCPAAHCSPGTVHSDHSPAFLLGLLASVPSCVEDLSNPVAEPSSQQAGSVSSAGE